MTEILDELVALSNRLGNPANEYVILGEGNTSARVDDDTFWVKGSGTRLLSSTGDGFVRVRGATVLALLDQSDADDDDVETALFGARIGATGGIRPSVETLLHAVCQRLDGVSYVAHTHPVAVNAVMCSKDFDHALSGRLFPDEVVMCGPAPVVVPYVDPGLPLARAVDRGIRAHMETWGAPPKTIFMRSHGLVRICSSAAAVEDITAMATKSAKILVGTYALGGPHFMSGDDVARIHTRPDEDYRKKVLGSD